MPGVYGAHMHAHLVFAHPLPESLGASLAAAAEAALVARGATVDRLDLYAENFDPRLTPTERIDHYGTPNPPPDVADAPPPWAQTLTCSTGVRVLRRVESLWR